MPVVVFPNGNGSGKLPPPPSILASDSLDPIHRLTLVLQAEARAQEEWHEAERAADEIDPEHWDQLEQARKNVRAAYRRWFEVSQQAHELSEAVRRSTLELPQSRQYQDLYQKLLESLQEQFDGGPHYDLLCERVAGLSVRLKQMEQSGRSYTPAEHATLNQQLLSYIGQLQKYTEAMKSESISKETQLAVEQILALVESRLATSYPELWLI